MSKLSPKRFERLEDIAVGAGFLLKKLQARYGSDFGVGMSEQVRDCLKDIRQVELARLNREKQKEKEKP